MTNGTVTSTAIVGAVTLVGHPHRIYIMAVGTLFQMLRNSLDTALRIVKQVT